LGLTAAWSALDGGNGLAIFNPSVVDYLMGKKLDTLECPDIETIPDYEMREQLKKVSKLLIEVIAVSLYVGDSFFKDVGFFQSS
jgi:hypothetical protein